MQPADNGSTSPSPNGTGFREGPLEPESTAIYAPQAPWYKELTGYQWFVFIVCCLAWDMDCMDQQLFNLARRPAMQDLVAKVLPTDARLAELKEKLDAKSKKPTPIEDVIAAQQNADIGAAAGWATSIFMIGWAVGGIGFGIMGDRVGRVKTLMLTILLYAIFTGLSALSRSTLDFYIYRFLTGLGVGGVFAAAVTLLAETMPERSRALLIGLFQASSALGNCAAAGISIGFGWAVYNEKFADQQLLGFDLDPWRLMFLVGIIPGLLVVLIQFWLKEPEKWLASRAAGGQKGGSYTELLGDSRYQRNAIFGLILALAGVIGLWGIGFFSFDLLSYVMNPRYAAEAAARGLTGTEAANYVIWERSLWSGITSLLQNGGAFLGIFVFSYVSVIAGRRPTFAVFFILAGGMTAVVFLFIDSFAQIFWMIPLMGFFQLAIFGGYAIYFPELFPTRLRSTGTSFCYNVGRLIAASGPALLGLLTSHVFQGYPFPYPLRYAGVAMCSVFILGLIALPFLPETKGNPLPE
ncbi:MAG TPA: MFS transporter [Gemmataceae bacterium]|nr:MFS transporter [Gemmataceae bacterium]